MDKTNKIDNVLYDFVYDPKGLVNPTDQTLEFIDKMCSGILVQNSGDHELGIEPNDYFITAVKINPGFKMWKTSKKWVFIWLDRVSEISLKGNNRIKYMHKFYSYFLIDKDVKIEIEPSKNRFDFGIHRVQKSLNEHNAVKYLEVQIQDFTGVQDSAGVLAITERDIKRAVDALFEEKEKLEERLNLESIETNKEEEG